MLKETGTNFLVRSSRIFKRSLKLRIGIILFTVLVISVILEPAINNYRLGGHESTEIGVYDALLPFAFEHPLGTDHYGRDVFALLLTGLKYSLFIGLMAGGLATLIAVSLALMAGYKGGRLETLVTTFTNAVLIIPLWPILAIAVLFVERADLVLIIVILAFFSWPWACRQITPQIASLKERPYIELAKVSGLRDLEIMFKEILPNFLPYVIVGFSYAVAGAIMAETALRLVGLGPGAIPSLGLLINWAMYTGALAQQHYVIVLSPILLLVLIFVSLNFINIGLDEVYNPRLKKITGL